MRYNESYPQPAPIPEWTALAKTDEQAPQIYVTNDGRFAAWGGRDWVVLANKRAVEKRVRAAADPVPVLLVSDYPSPYGKGYSELCAVDINREGLLRMEGEVSARRRSYSEQVYHRDEAILAELQALQQQANQIRKQWGEVIIRLRKVTVSNFREHDTRTD